MGNHPSSQCSSMNRGVTFLKNYILSFEGPAFPFGQLYPNQMVVLNPPPPVSIGAFPWKHFHSLAHLSCVHALCHDCVFIIFEWEMLEERGRTMGRTISVVFFQNVPVFENFIPYLWRHPMQACDILPPELLLLPLIPPMHGHSFRPHSFPSPTLWCPACIHWVRRKQ